MAERAINYIKENKRRGRASKAANYRNGEIEAIRRACRITQELSP